MLTNTRKLSGGEIKLNQIVIVLIWPAVMCGFLKGFIDFSIIAYVTFCKLEAYGCSNTIKMQLKCMYFV